MNISNVDQQAADTLYYGIASANDIETAMTKGVKLSKRFAQLGKWIRYFILCGKMDKLYDFIKKTDIDAVHYYVICTNQEKYFISNYSKSPISAFLRKSIPKIYTKLVEIAIVHVEQFFFWKS